MTTSELTSTTSATSSIEPARGWRPMGRRDQITKIIPVQPNADHSTDPTATRGTHGNKVASRRTFGHNLPSRRTFGHNLPSRRTFGHNLPSRRAFGARIA